MSVVMVATSCPLAERRDEVVAAFEEAIVHVHDQGGCRDLRPARGTGPDCHDWEVHLGRCPGRAREGHRLGDLVNN